MVTLEAEEKISNVALAKHVGKHISDIIVVATALLACFNCPLGVIS